MVLQHPISDTVSATHKVNNVVKNKMEMEAGINICVDFLFVSLIF